MKLKDVTHIMQLCWYVNKLNKETKVSFDIMPDNSIEAQNFNVTVWNNNQILESHKSYVIDFDYVYLKSKLNGLIKEAKADKSVV